MGRQRKTIALLSILSLIVTLDGLRLKQDPVNPLEDFDDTSGCILAPALKALQAKTNAATSNVCASSPNNSEFELILTSANKLRDAVKDKCNGYYEKLGSYVTMAVGKKDRETKINEKLTSLIEKVEKSNNPVDVESLKEQYVSDYAEPLRIYNDDMNKYTIGVSELYKHSKEADEYERMIMAPSNGKVVEWSKIFTPMDSREKDWIDALQAFNERWAKDFNEAVESIRAVAERVKVFISAPDITKLAYDDSKAKLQNILNSDSMKRALMNKPELYKHFEDLASGLGVLAEGAKLPEHFNEYEVFYKQEASVPLKFPTNRSDLKNFSSIITEELKKKEEAIGLNGERLLRDLSVVSAAAKSILNQDVSGEKVVEQKVSELNAFVDSANAMKNSVNNVFSLLQSAENQKLTEGIAPAEKDDTCDPTLSADDKKKCTDYLGFIKELNEKMTTLRQSITGCSPLGTDSKTWKDVAQETEQFNFVKELKHKEAFEKISGSNTEFNTRAEACQAVIQQIAGVEAWVKQQFSTSDPNAEKIKVQDILEKLEVIRAKKQETKEQYETSALEGGKILSDMCDVVADVYLLNSKCVGEVKKKTEEFRKLSAVFTTCRNIDGLWCSILSNVIRNTHLTTKDGKRENPTAHTLANTYSFSMLSPPYNGLDPQNILSELIPETTVPTDQCKLSKFEEKNPTVFENSCADFSATSKNKYDALKSIFPKMEDLLSSNVQFQTKYNSLLAIIDLISLQDPVNVNNLQVAQDVAKDSYFNHCEQDLEGTPQEDRVNLSEKKLFGFGEALRDVDAKTCSDVNKQLLEILETQLVDAQKKNEIDQFFMTQQKAVQCFFQSRELSSREVSRINQISMAVKYNDKATIDISMCPNVRKQ